MNRIFTRRIMALMLWVALLVFCATAQAAYTVKSQWVRFTATAGETLTTGQVVCLKDADGYAYKADANDAALRPAIGVVGLGAASGAKVEIITIGILRGWTTLSEGGYAYLSDTAAAVTQSAPTYEQIIGVAISATEYFFNFSRYLDTSALTALGVLSGATPLILEGATANDFENTVTVTDPTADRSTVLPDAGGTVMLSSLATNGADAANAVTGASNGLVFEGATADAFEATVSATDPTADRSVVLPDAGGTVMLSSLATNGADAANAVTGASNGLVYEGATADAHETTVAVTDPTADRTVTIPDRTGQVQIAGAGSALTPGAAVTLTVGLSNLYTLAINDNEDTTITFSGAGTAGDEITIVIATGAGATGDEVVTFHATLVSSAGTLTCADAASKFYAIRFISNGTHWYEVSRSGQQT